MLTHKTPILFTAIMLAFCVSASFAQYTVITEEMEIPLNIAQKVASQNGVDVSDTKAMVSIPPSAYLKAGGNVETSTMHLASNGHYAIEAREDGEKTTTVWDGKINIIMWAQKKVMQMTPEQIEQMVQNAKAMLAQAQENMPDIAQMLENANIPKEQREAAQKALAGMSNAKGAAPSKPEISKTGKKATIAGSSVSLYIVQEDDKTRGIWASKDNKALVEKFKQIAESMAALNEIAEENETPDWELLPDMYPLAVVEISKGMYGQSNMSVNSTKSIKKGKPSKKAFHIPGTAEGFQVGGMEIMMQGFNQ